MGAKLTLSDGREITITASKMSVREYRALISPKGSPDSDDATLAKYSGLTVDELLDLTQADYRAIVLACVREANRQDPNSAGASISE